MRQFYAACQDRSKPVKIQTAPLPRQVKSLTSGEQKTKLIDEGQSPNNTETLSGTRTRSGSFLVRRRSEFVQHGCTNDMGLLCGLSASDGAARVGSTWIVQPGCTLQRVRCTVAPLAFQIPRDLKKNLQQIANGQPRSISQRRDSADDWNGSLQLRRDRSTCKPISATARKDKAKTKTE